MRAIAVLIRIACLGCLPLLALDACGSTQSASQFPSRDELRKLAERPAVNQVQPGNWADVAEWEVTGPLPDVASDAPAPLDGPWNGLLADLAKARPGLLMAANAANCTARELGVFFAAKRAQSAGALQRFVAARCGLTGTLQIAHGYRYQETPTAMDERVVFAQWSPLLKDELQKAVASSTGPHLIGIWFGQRDGLAIASWVVVPRQARVDPIPMVPGADGQVVVHGEVVSRADRIEGLINRGAYGFRRCETDPKVRMPQFTIRCQADPADVSANVQIAAFDPGRVLGHTILSLIVWPKGELGTRYRRPSLASSAGAAEVTPSGNVVSELVSLVGQVRAQAGMKALRLSEAQSGTARRLAPHYFAALAGLEPENIADQVVLGLRAGWEVGAPLRVGQFTYGAIEGTESTSRLLSEALDAPSGREALLAPDVDHLAVGVIGGPGQGFVGAVFGTYATFELGDARSHAEQLYRRLSDLRAQKGLPRAEALPQLAADLSAVIREVSMGKWSANQGLEHALSLAAERTQAPVRAHFVDALELAQLAIPDELVAAPSLRIAIAVGQYQPKGDPWQRHIVYFVAVDRIDVLALR